MNVRAYLDNNATTRLASEALAAMTPYLTDLYFNPSSAAGEMLGAGRPLQDAKDQLARLLGAADAADRFVLTSGASEANSWAVYAATYRKPPGHIVSSAIEHPSLLAALEACRDAGWTVDLAPPDDQGRILPAAVAGLVRGETSLVSVMYANNETGVIQPVREIGESVREKCRRALFHVDATQAVGRIPTSLDDALSWADLVSLSGHKFHGPKGSGALFAAEGISLPPLIHGSQEEGRRGGTPDAAAAAGLAAAARRAVDRLPQMTHVGRLRDQFEARLRAEIAGVCILGADAQRLPNTSAFLIPGVDGTAVVEVLARRGVIIAAGSACMSGSPSPSHVLLAMGVDYGSARSALRVSLSHESTAAEIELAAHELVTLARESCSRLAAEGVSWRETIARQCELRGGLAG